VSCPYPHRRPPAHPSQEPHINPLKRESGPSNSMLVANPQSLIVASDRLMEGKECPFKKRDGLLRNQTAGACVRIDETPK